MARSVVKSLNVSRPPPSRNTRRHPFIVESFYSRGFFTGFRWLWDHTLGYSPVPLLYVLLSAVVVWRIERIFRRVSGRKVSLHRPTSLPEKIGRSALLVGSRLGILVFFSTSSGDSITTGSASKSKETQEPSLFLQALFPQGKGGSGLSLLFLKMAMSPRMSRENWSLGPGRRRPPS